VPALTNGVERRLAPEHEDNEGQGSQRLGSEIHLKSADRQDAGAESQQQRPMMTPDVVKRPMRQAFGIGDGRTLSVVKDMERKSPVIITMTISSGSESPCQVINQADD